MYNVISISLGEIVLKGKNRGYFERILMEQIRNAINEFENVKAFKDKGKVFVSTKNEEDIPKILDKIDKIFGIVQISPCVKIEKDMETIIEKTKEFFNFLLENEDIKTFKISANRTDKKFPMKSMEINRFLGGVILENFSDMKVDVHNPDVYIYLDIKNDCYLYAHKIKTVGGLPVGTNGKGLLLLSGGIDSPVAGKMIAKRGVKVDAMYFHAYPFTSERTDEKVKKLAEIMSVYCGEIKLHSVNIAEIYKAIREHCPEREMTIIARRFMMRIAEKIANENDLDVLITGENLGQVASQTIKSIGVINDVVKLPILRPLIGMDKTEIIEIAKEINTYETSILPFDDCCAIFAPNHPVTNPNLDRISNSEAKLDVDKLIQDAIDTMKIELI